MTENKSPANFTVRRAFLLPNKSKFITMTKPFLYSQCNI
nr:MAG TPA: hypothetical protein [Caudoviricetes sp.]